MGSVGPALLQCGQYTVTNLSGLYSES